MNLTGRSAIVVCLWSSTAVGADTIALKAAARLGPRAEAVTLADIADLSGAEAIALGGLEIARLNSSEAGVIEIPIGAVRAKLDEAGAHWGRISLSGRSVIVRPARDAAAAPPLAMMPIALSPGEPTASPKAAARDEFGADVLIAGGALRGVIADLLVSNLHIQPGDLRLSFDRQDADLLDCSTREHRFEVQPLASLTSDRIDCAVRTWSGGKSGHTRTVSVLPQVRVRVAILRCDVAKGRDIAEDDVEAAERWLPPSQAALAVDRIEAIGRVAAKSLKAGDLLREGHIRRDTLIKRGDLAVVRCLVGGIAISLRAEARGDGAEGDLIEFRKQGERDTFLATVTARGEAVVDLAR
jgi:flagella basal body P-ring formation protein FlgA